MNILQLPNAVFLVGLIVQCAIRRHFVQRTKSEKKTVRQFDRTEKILLAAMFPPVLLLTRQKKGVAQSNNYKQENANERRPGHALGRGAGLPSSAESARDVHCRASQRCAAGLPTGNAAPNEHPRRHLESLLVSRLLLTKVDGAGTAMGSPAGA